MAPVDADVMNGSINAHSCGIGKSAWRKVTNSADVISPDAIANSRCLVDPRPPAWPWIRTL